MFGSLSFDHSRSLKGVGGHPGRLDAISPVLRLKALTRGAERWAIPTVRFMTSLSYYLAAQVLRSASTNSDYGRPNRSPGTGRRSTLAEAGVRLIFARLEHLGQPGRAWPLIVIYSKVRTRPPPARALGTRLRSGGGEGMDCLLEGDLGADIDTFSGPGRPRRHHPAGAVPDGGGTQSKLFRFGSRAALGRCDRGSRWAHFRWKRILPRARPPLPDRLIPSSSCRLHSELWMDIRFPSAAWAWETTHGPSFSPPPARRRVQAQPSMHERQTPTRQRSTMPRFEPAGINGLAGVR